jgi:hypothetical protein
MEYFIIIIISLIKCIWNFKNRTANDFSSSYMLNLKVEFNYSSLSIEVFNFQLVTTHESLPLCHYPSSSPLSSSAPFVSSFLLTFDLVLIFRVMFRCVTFVHSGKWRFVPPFHSEHRKVRVFGTDFMIENRIFVKGGTKRHSPVHSSCDVLMYFYTFILWCFRTFVLWCFDVLLYSPCDVRVHCILQGPFYILRTYIRDRENEARLVLLVIRIKHLALTTRIVTQLFNFFNWRLQLSTIQLFNLFNWSFQLFT